LDAPQVFILDSQTAAALIKGRKKQPFVFLIDKEAQTVNNIISELINKSNDDGSYGTYIINEEMGTCTDFKLRLTLKVRVDYCWFLALNLLIQAHSNS
jgi:hypothetical protein